MRDGSWRNFGLEVQNNVKSDMDQMHKYGEFMADQ